MKATFDKFGGDHPNQNVPPLNVVIVYVIEAHPVGSVCPYKGVEDVTPENERDNILRHQPKTLEDRLELAAEFKRYLRVDTPIYVDTMKNEAWKAFGAAPNIAFLVDDRGIVSARQGWFDGEKLEASIVAQSVGIEKRINNPWRDKRNARDLSERTEVALKAAGAGKYEFFDMLRDKDTRKLEAALQKISKPGELIFVDLRGGYERTLLMEAIAERNPAAVDLVIRLGVDVNAKTSMQDSALQLAAETGELEIVESLLKYHANPNFPASGKTPLHEALLAKSIDIAQLLVAKGAKEDFYSNVGLGRLEEVRRATRRRSFLGIPPGWRRPDVSRLCRGHGATTIGGSARGSRSTSREWKVFTFENSVDDRG